ncbi:MAG: calcium-binding protein [Synechococcaceae cyanobacterium]|nr:calcium-binding protein [Synechococcaceae cyanobacterium]
MASLSLGTGVVGSTPLVLGYNMGHFMPGSNAADWWRYAGARAARAFISASDIEPVDDIAGIGDGVSSRSGFESRRNGLRANAANGSVNLDTTYVNWAAFQERHQNAIGDNNRFAVGPAFSSLRQQGVEILANITASPSRFQLAESEDWGNAWELWQHYYAQAFLLSRDYGVQRFSMFNEPNNWTWPSGVSNPVENWHRRLLLASDAIRSALSDVNSRYGRQLQAQIFAPNTANGATKYNTGSDTWGRKAVLSRRQNAFGETMVSGSNFDVYNYQKYDTSAADYISDFQSLRSDLNADGASDLPLALTEFNVRTGSNYDSRVETLDSPSDYAALAANCIALSQVGASQLYLFKFAQTLRSGGTYPVAKNGTHYVQNGTGSGFNVGGATKGAEVYRLFVKASGSARERLSSSSDAGSGLWSQVSRDPGSGDLYVFLANTGTSAIDLSLDLSAHGLPEGSLAVVEEVSQRFSGGVSRLASVSNGQLPAASLGPQSVWLVTLPGATTTGTINAEADTVVADGIGRNSAAGGDDAVLLVRADGKADGRRVSLLRFSLADLNPSRTERVLLNLQAATIQDSSSIQAHLYGLNDDSWSETSSWSSLSQVLRQGVADGRTIAENVVANPGTISQILGQVVVDSPQFSTRQFDVSDFVLSQSDGWASFLLVQDHRWDQALPSLTSGDAQTDGLRIVSREGSSAGSAGPQLLLLNRPIADSVAPTVTAASVNGSTVTLELSETVRGQAIIPGHFRRRSGESLDSATAVTPGSTGGSSSLSLTFATAAASDREFTLLYTPDSGSLASGLVSDSAGNVLTIPTAPVLTYVAGSSVSQLHATYANLTLTGSAVSGSGNERANRIVGNAAANVLEGRGGADTMDGAAGSDVYLIAAAEDHAAGERISDSGGSGSDEIRFSSTISGQTLVLQPEISGIERVTIASSGGSSSGTTALHLDASAVTGSGLQLIGNSGSNQLTGSALADELIGGLGQDVLNGGAGSDRHVLTGISSALHGDRLIGFTPGSGGDVLVLSDALSSRSGSGTARLAELQRGSSISLNTGSSSGSDLFVLQAANDESDVNLANSSDGTALLDGLNAASGSAALNTSSKGGRGYLLAYDNGFGYLYAFNAGSNTSVSASEIQRIAVIEGLSPLGPGGQALVAANVLMA